MVSAAIALEIFICFLVSAATCGVILLTRDLHMPLAARRGDTRSTQAAHRRPTPRIGGLAIIAALAPIALLLPDDLAGRFLLFAPSLLPILIAGLSEDLGWPVRPRNRMIAAAVSSLLAILFLRVWLPQSGLPGLDRLMLWAPVAIAFTVFACTGICNAFNLVDGINGLSATIGCVAALSMAVIAERAGETSVFHMNLMLTGALMGFLVFNFPFGKIFLGDAGAYSLGHILSWFAIALLIRVPELTPWAMVLIFFWPVADTFFAIYRRIRSGRPTGQPDRLHFHQLVMRALEISVMGRNSRELTNPLSTVVMIPMFVMPAVTGVYLWNKPLLAAAALATYALLFVASYQAGLIYARKTRLRPSTADQ